MPLILRKKKKSGLQIKNVIHTNVGICEVTRKSEASFTSCLCFFRESEESGESTCFTPGENTSGLNL